MICAGYQLGGRGPCPGDSGGPLVKYVTKNAETPYYLQVGVVSGGIGNCGDSAFPGVYGSLQHPPIWKFIQNNLNDVINIDKDSCEVDLYLDHFVNFEVKNQFNGILYGL